MGKKEYTLSKRELDIMNVLWAEGKPLIASEIPERQPGLSINTVHAVLKKLLQKGLIVVADIVQSGTVLSRSYKPAITPEEYAVKYMTSEVFALDQLMSKVSFLSALFDDSENDEELIRELEKLVQEKTALLEKNKKK